MPDYSKSKIYKLTSSNSDEIYIGSTVLYLSKRKAHHFEDYKKYLSNKRGYITSFKILEYGGEIDICLLEEYNCKTKEELHARERFYIENNNCVNKFIPGRQINEWLENTKEKRKQQQKEYNELNKEKIRERKKKYRELNIEKIKANDKIYWENNKDKINEKRRK
jgi:hypothetical protein